jgi:hypothetical protein
MAGACASMEQSCNGFGCEGTECATSCKPGQVREGNQCVACGASGQPCCNGQCMGGSLYCGGGRCQAQKGNGSGCSGSQECQSGNCVDNRLCCANNQKICNGKCIDRNDCCGDGDCSSKQECSGGSCRDIKCNACQTAANHKCENKPEFPGGFKESSDTPRGGGASANSRWDWNCDGKTEVADPKEALEDCSRYEGQPEYACSVKAATRSLDTGDCGTTVMRNAGCENNGTPGPGEIQSCRIRNPTNVKVKCR